MKPHLHIHLPALFEKTPPHSEESEMALLGAMLLHPSCIDEVVTLTQASDFYNDSCRAVFASCTFIYREEGALDLVTVSSDLDRQGQLADVGGTDFLVKLASETPGVAGVARWARDIHELGCVRRVIEGAGKTIYNCYHADRETDASAIAQEGIDMLAAAASTVDTGRTRPLGQAARELMEHIDKGQPLFERTGLAWFDQINGGLPKTGVISIIGQNGHGKSTLALMLMLQLASRNGGMGRIHSVEQGPDRVSGTLLSFLTGLPVHDWANQGYIPNQTERHAVSKAIESLDASGIVVDPTSLDASGIYRQACAALRKGHRRVMVDYIQDLKPMPGHKNDAEGLSESMRMLARIRTDLNMAVYVLIQMDKVSRQANKTPTLIDGRGSTAFSDATDFGIAIHRPHFNDKPEDHYDTAALDELRALTDIAIVKNKYGRMGNATVLFDGNAMRFRPRGSLPSGPDGKPTPQPGASLAGLVGTNGSGAYCGDDSYLQE